MNDKKKTGLADMAGCTEEYDALDTTRIIDPETAEKEKFLIEALTAAQKTDNAICDNNILKAIDEYVGRRCRLERQKQEVSQMNLSSAIDISYQQIQKYEKADDRISASRLYQIAHFFKISPARFFEGLPFTTPTLSNDHIEILRCYDALPEDSKADALDLMKIMGGRDRRR